MRCEQLSRSSLVSQKRRDSARTEYLRRCVFSQGQIWLWADRNKSATFLQHTIEDRSRLISLQNEKEVIVK